MAGESQEDERLYREEGLSLRRRAQKKATAVPRVALPLPSEPGRCYAMDCVHDRLANGRRFKCVTMTDLCSKEVPVIEVDNSIGGEHVCRILDRLFAEGPLPEIVILDNRPECSGTALDVWPAQHGVTLHFIQPGKPVRKLLWILLDPFLHGIQQDILFDGFSKMVRAAGS
jgi:putative transposase